MSAEASVASCPRCGSTVRRGSDWCTLCFADLRPVPPPRVSPDPPMVPPPASPELTAALMGTTGSSDMLNPLAGFAVGVGESAPASAVSTASLASPGGRNATIPCRTCGEPVSLEVAVCGACGTGLFDALKDEAASVTLPVIGDVMKLGKGARTGLAFAFAVIVVAVLFVVITLVGHFL